MAPSTFAAALGAALAASAFGAEVLVDARARGLGADDACSAEAGPGCAVSALQRTSGRSGAAVGLGQEAAEPPNKNTGASDEEWVWPRETLDKHMRTERYKGDQFWTQIEDIFAPRLVQHCLRFNAYFWPQTSFWSQEVLRRVDALPDDMDAATQKQLQDFTRKASFLMCNFWLDPRQGTNWSQPVTEYMSKVKAMPSTSLDMPRLEGDFFTDNSTLDNLWSGDSCMYWASNLMCDVGTMARELQGRKDLSDELCWDKVATPDAGFSVFGVSLQAGRPGVADSDNDYEHPEYQACQEKPLNKDVLGKHCPMFGHYPSGYMNVSYWGTALPKGSSGREEVLKCEKKLGIPNGSPTTSGEVTHRPWDTEHGGVDLMNPPPAGWKATSYFDLKNQTKAFTHAVRDAVLPALTPNCKKDDVWCIVMTLDKLRKSSEKKSGVHFGGPEAAGAPNQLLEVHAAMEAHKSAEKTI